MTHEIIYHAACTLDGFIATKEGGVDWLMAFDDQGKDYGFGEFLASVDSVVSGSATYEFTLANPPWVAPDKKSWVFTRRELEISHPSITLTNESPREVVKQMQSQGLKRTWLLGGGKLASAFQREGLLTGIEIAVVPVMLGEGIPLFAEGALPANLKLEKCAQHENGFVTLSYSVEQA